ncbi:A/G-specific adenine glycosylase [Candidatus Bipolaricaulota bacterium]|nr:A/G-specific adenine glycosylase [Candidatus Bipolaricaulota bacterium]
MKKKEEFSKLILKWWKENKRDFSWRHFRDPYRILIAEFFLRKTTAKQVQRIYSTFIKKYPSPKDILKADFKELKKIIRPLGMEHKRAELLKKFAKVIVESYNGIIPLQKNELMKLPGVGLYTANAVLTLSSGKDLPLLDTNFIRVIERVFDKKSKKSRARTDKELWKFAESLIPPRKGREFNFAVLDLGAVICKPRDPKCETCPLKVICIFYNTDQRGVINEIRKGKD